MPKQEIRSTKKSVSGRQKKTVGLSVPVYSLEGQETGRLDLPKEIFGAKVNKILLAQAVRVYENNLRGHYSHTKTRSEVRGSTHKLYRQKGTGHARHGSAKAPIFVGGGIALGPKSRKVVLRLPKKMKKAALICALSDKYAGKEIIALGNTAKISKTSQLANFINKVTKGSTLIVSGDKEESLVKAGRNLSRVAILNVSQVNSYEVVKYQTLVLTKEAVEKLEVRILG